MAYSDWQLNRLRDALRAYHDYGGRSLKEDFNWNSVAEAIAVELDRDDLPVSAERLRQFVEGNRSKDGAMRKFGTLKPESLEHVVAFAMKLRLLLPEELEEPAPSFHAPQRLLEYLDTRNDRVRVIHAGHLRWPVQGARHRTTRGPGIRSHASSLVASPA